MGCPIETTKHRESPKSKVRKKSSPKTAGQKKTESKIKGQGTKNGSNQETTGKNYLKHIAIWF